MDRRNFLVAGAAAVPALALAAEVAAPVATSDLVDFTSDGLGLGAREYAALLQDITASRDVQPDNYSLGGEVARIEAWFAARLGKEAAMFVPTGTLANHLAVRKLAGAGKRVLVQAESHLYNDSGDAASALSALNLVPLAEGRATMSLDEVRRAVERSRGGRVPQSVGAISIENPVRRRGHEMVDAAELDRVCAYAREQGIRLHLDGARLFNLPLHSTRSVREHCAPFDTVYVSLWKHFNGASGAILAGDAAFIDGLYNERRMFGGSLPQAWPLVAPVLRYAETYEADYARAWQVADETFALLAGHGFEVRKPPGGTSKFTVMVTGGDPAQLPARALERGIRISQPRAGTGEFALMVNNTLLRRAPSAIARDLLEARG